MRLIVTLVIFPICLIWNKIKLKFGDKSETKLGFMLTLVLGLTAILDRWLQLVLHLDFLKLAPALH